MSKDCAMAMWMGAIHRKGVFGQDRITYNMLIYKSLTNLKLQFMPKINQKDGGIILVSGGIIKICFNTINF